MLCSLVPVLMVDQVWPKIAEGMKRSVARCDGDLTASFLWQLCRSGPGFLLIATDEANNVVGASVWRFEQYHSGHKFSCLALAGKGLKSWHADMRDLATRIAKDGGANGLISEGSRAYGRIFPDAKEVRTRYEVPI